MPKDYLKIRNKFITKVHIDMQQIIDEMALLIKLDSRIYKQIGRGSYKLDVNGEKMIIKGDDVDTDKITKTFIAIDTIYETISEYISDSLDIIDTFFEVPEQIKEQFNDLLGSDDFIHFINNQRMTNINDAKGIYARLKENINKIFADIPDKRSKKQLHILLLKNFYMLNPYYFSPTIDNDALPIYNEIYKQFPCINKLLNLFLFNTIFDDLMIMDLYPDPDKYKQSKFSYKIFLFLGIILELKIVNPACNEEINNFMILISHGVRLRDDDDTETKIQQIDTMLTNFEKIFEKIKKL